jgi:hydroxypyruvate reductase
LRAGEPTVSIRDGGRGGRCQHHALSFACERVEGATLAALSTDGIDGPTDAAGAIVDDDTFDALERLHVDARAHAARCDSYPALDAAGALVRTGPSGTNVSDLAILLVTPRG